MIVARCAFEKYPNWYSVVLEFYMNTVYFFDMLKTFVTPIHVRKKDNALLISNYRDLGRQYLKTWLIPEAICFFPVAYLRSVSKLEDGSSDDIQNFLNLNFQRLPRLYIIFLFPKLLRARKILELWPWFLNYLDLGL
jgi:hypothetical protein